MVVVVVPLLTGKMVPIKKENMNNEKRLREINNDLMFVDFNRLRDMILLSLSPYPYP
jgi:hypothetical protein